MLNDGKQILSDALKAPPQVNYEVEFRYSHERRLERASKTVQEFNTQGIKRSSILGSLTATRSHKMLLISIVVLCVAISVITKIINNKDASDIGGNGLAISAMRYEGKTFVVIKKTAKKTGAYTGLVDVAISQDAAKAAKDKTGAKRAAGSIFTEKIYFMPEASEDFRISVPVEIENLLLLLQAESESAVARVKAE
jgi:hypothetical protein